jgi:hypothetical protein
MYVLVPLCLYAYYTFCQHIFVLDFQPYSNPGAYFIELVFHPIPYLGFSCDSGSDLSDPLPSTSFPRLLVMPHLELGAATAIMGEEISDFKSESHFGLTKSQKWLLVSLW